jgi:folate-binding protein YgfZ
MTEATVAPPIPDLDAQYRGAVEGAAFAERPDVGRLLFSGKDAADLLHRLSTNAVKALREGQGTATVFTTNKGRILDLVTLHRLPAGFLAHVAAERVRPLADWIERYTFREEVRAEDLGATHRTGSIVGPRAAQVATRLAGAAAGSLALHALATFRVGAHDAWLARTFPLAEGGFFVTAPIAAWEGVRAACLDDPAGGVIEIDARGLEILRIAAGLPAPGRELTEEFNPWEARLDDAIALDKGCYVGQEVIARLNTYKKVSKYLVRFAIAGDPPPAGAAVRRGAETIGAVTSAVALPGAGGRSIALGYVRDEEAVAGVGVTIDAPGGSLPATIEGVAR